MKKKRIIRKDKNLIYFSLKDAAMDLGVSICTVRNYLKKNRSLNGVKLNYYVGRPNIHENYEDVLMCSTGFNRVKKNVDPSHLNDREFKSVVRHISRIFYRKNLDLMERTNYEIEDIESVFRMRALIFSASGYDIKDRRTFFMFLMRHLTQRFKHIASVIERKHKYEAATIRAPMWDETGAEVFHD